MRNYSRYATDPILSGLAASLKEVNFDLAPDAHEAFFEKGLSGRLINVAPLLDGKTFRVRMYLGGKQRCIGLTTNGPAAARFADMARLFFWPYRVRDCREPVDTDMNNSVQQAEDDMQENEGALRLLESIRDHLIKFGDLKVRSPGDKSERRATLAGAICQDISEFRAEHAASIKRFEQAQKALFDDLKKAFHHIRDRLDTLEKYTLPPPDTTPGHPDNPNFDPKFCSNIP